MTTKKSESSFLIKEIRANGIPPFWKDTKKMQEAYSLKVKGRVCSVPIFEQNILKNRVVGEKQKNGLF